MQPRPLRPKPGHPDLERRPVLAEMHLVRHARPLAREHRFGLVRSEAGHILHLDAVARRGLQHALASVRQHHGAQHAVALDELLPGALQPVTVEGARLQFEIEMSTYVAELQHAGAADPICLLDVGERKRLGPCRGVGHKRG